MSSNNIPTFSAKPDRKEKVRASLRSMSSRKIASTLKGRSDVSQTVSDAEEEATLERNSSTKLSRESSKNALFIDFVWSDYQARYDHLYSSTVTSPNISRRAPTKTESENTTNETQKENSQLSTSQNAEGSVPLKDSQNNQIRDNKDVDQQTSDTNRTDTEHSGSPNVPEKKEKKKKKHKKEGHSHSKKKESNVDDPRAIRQSQSFQNQIPIQQFNQPYQFVEPVWSNLDISQLLQFPDDDFIVLRITKPSRVELPPEEISLPQIQEPYIREIVKIFSGDCKIIYQHYQLKYGNKSKLLSSSSTSSSGAILPSKSARATQNTPLLSEEKEKEKDKEVPQERVPDAKHLSDPGQLRTGVELLKDLLEDDPVSSDVSPSTSQPATPAQTPSSSRKSDASTALDELLHKIPPYNPKDPSLLQLRQDLFKAFPVSEKDLNPGVINPPEPFTERLAPYLLLLNDFFLDVSHISQQLDNVTKYPQPLFFSFSLHNYKTKQKISEDFHVISFGETQYKMEHSNWTNRKGLFALPTTMDYSSVVLVVTINKIFSSSDKDSGWFKEKEKDTPQGKSLRRVDSNSQVNQSQDASEYNAQVLSLIEYIRNGQLVITPLLWGYTQIFDGEGKLMGSVQNPVQLAKQLQTNSKEGSTPSQLSPQPTQTKLKTRKFDPDLKLVKSGMCVTYEIIYDTISNETHGKTNESNAISVMSLPSLVTSNLPLNFNERQKFKSSGCKFEIELSKLSHEPKSPRITPSQYQVKTNYETALQFYHNLFGIAHSNSSSSTSSATRIQQFQLKQRLPFSASSSNLSSAVNVSSTYLTSEKEVDDQKHVCITTNSLLIPKHNGLGLVQEVEVWGEIQNYEDPNQDREKQDKDMSLKDTSSTSSSYPYLSYVNNLYVYIESVNVKAPSDANIQVKVQLKHNDKSLHTKDEEKYFYSMTGELVPFMFTTIASHTKTPQFCDEMKLKLPPNLTPEHHLLFTFYNCTVKKGNKIYYPLAHAVLPLYKGSSVVSDDRYSLPVSKALFSDTNYLTQDIKWSKLKRLSLRTKLVSSIYPQDGDLNLFFLNYWREPASTKKHRSSTHSQAKPIVPPTESADPVKVIPNVPVDTIIKFMPPIMNILFQLIAKDDKHQAREAFICLLKILKRIDVHTNYSSLLHSYVVYLFDNPAGRGVYESICSFWLSVIESPMCGELMGGFKSYWFLFQIILKSLILELNSRGFLHSAALRFSKVPSTFQSNIIKLLSNLLRISMQSQLNYDVLVAFPLFITNLFPFINRGQLFKLIFQHLSSLDLSTMSTAFIKFTWLKIIGDYEHFIPLNLPTDLEMENFDVSQLKSEFWKRHFLSGTILDEASCCLRSSFNSKIREQAATLLRNLFRKHELDARYQNTNIQKYIASMYFPLIPMVIEQLYLVNEMGEVEQSRWLICFIYILKYVKKKLLATWWRKESQKTKEAFWSCVHTATSYFVEKPKGAEVNFIVLDTLIEFVNCFEKSLNKVSDSGIDNESQSNPLLEHILDILKILLSSPSDAFLSYLYCALNDILSRLSSSLFQTQTRYYCRDLIYDILRHCNQKDNDVRSKASSLLYALIKENWKQFKNISVIRHFAQLAQSKLVGSEKKKEYNYLLGSLDGLKKHCIADPEVADSSEGFIQQVNELVTRLMDITKYEKKIAQNWVDEEVTADIYIQIANDYRESPDLRLTWLDNLALIHVQWGNIEEAAQCKIHMSYLVAQYLVRVKPNVLPKNLRLAIPKTINDKNLSLKDKLNPSIVYNPFARIAPNILTDLHLSDEIFQDEGRFQSERWSINGLCELLRDAVTLLKRERRYELCLEIFHLLASIYKHDKSYAEMIKWAEQYKDICENLVKLTVEGKEIFSRYYRVTFFSKKWFGEDHRKVFIYKKKYRFTIGDVAQMIAKQLAHKTRLDPSQIVSLPNKEIDHSTLDLEKIYFQIVAVRPYFDEIEQLSEDRVSQFQQNFNISEFISEVPFMSDGGKFDEADVSRQQKRKTIFCIGKSFPYLNNRIEVAQSRDIVLTPIECAVEAMQQRASQFRSEVYCTPVRKNNLQALLTGTLATTVNVGPLRFCEVFIGNTNYGTDLQDKLRDAMAEVLLLSKAALQINERIIGPEQLPFQAMLEDKFQSTMQIFKTKFAGNVNWTKISSTIQQRELKAKQQANELEKKLVKQQTQKVNEN